MVTFSVCVEMLFSEEPFLERIERCSSVGVEAFEFWGRGEKDLEAVRTTAREYDLTIAGMLGSGASMVDPDGTEEAVRDIRE